MASNTGLEASPFDRPTPLIKVPWSGLSYGLERLVGLA